MSQRTATRARQTKETKIEVAVNLDGSGDYEVSTALVFSTTCLSNCHVTPNRPESFG